ncbi:hypothetical protein UY3_14413 [Chelonia mydas]|uniref:Uncharacterized protein n=1 Tax=Chelonia mydas TaxID=8469 RepID=M7AUT1_CHEMY|nr:hypothetical protein UY3_14413 [Chelonia mydas]
MGEQRQLTLRCEDARYCLTPLAYIRPTSIGETDKLLSLIDLYRRFPIDKYSANTSDWKPLSLNSSNYPYNNAASQKCSARWSEQKQILKKQSEGWATLKNDISTAMSLKDVKNPQP